MQPKYLKVIYTFGKYDKNMKILQNCCKEDINYTAAVGYFLIFAPKFNSVIKITY